MLPNGLNKFDKLNKIDKDDMFEKFDKDDMFDKFEKFIHGRHPPKKYLGVPDSEILHISLGAALFPK